MSALAERVGNTLKCCYCGQKVGVVQDDGTVLHHDYRTKIELLEGRMRLDCQRCRASLELRAQVTA